MPDAKPLPSLDELNRLFTYEPDTGALRWKHRPEMRRCHNSKWTGKIAGTTHGSYVDVSIGDRMYAAHRIIWKMMTGADPNVIDHKDRNPANNKWDNLRAATNTLNQANRKLKSRYLPRGVGKSGDRFFARIRANRVWRFLGYFETAEEAGEAYRRAAVEIFGEFACVETHPTTDRQEGRAGR